MEGEELDPVRSYRPGPGPVGIGSFDPISAKPHRKDQEAVVSELPRQRSWTLSRQS